METREVGIVVDSMTKVEDIGNFDEWFNKEKVSFLAGDYIALDPITITQLYKGN